MRWGLILFLLLTIAGCSRSVLDAVRDYGLTPIAPVTNLTPGVLIDASGIAQGNPSILAEPTDVLSRSEFESMLSEGAAPNVTDNARRSFELNAFAPLPAALRLAAEARGARSFSVVATKNTIQQVKILAFEQQLPRFLSRFPALTRWIEQNQAAYIQRAWLAGRVEYTFYNQFGADVKLDLGSLSGVEAGWTGTNEGSIVYDASDGQAGRIVLGVDIRPLESPDRGLSTISPNLKARAARIVLD